jgi:eukaryotic-like serine/threonine-protein kinase
MATMLCLNDYVDRFEEAWSAGSQPDLLKFMPSGDEQEVREIALELMRVDLERRWSAGNPEPLISYFQRFPWLNQATEAKGALAFEEYRIRRARGEDVKPEEYSQRWHVDSKRWPKPPLPSVETASLLKANTSTLEILKQDASRLVESVEVFPSAGETFGGFYLERELGRGKFSRVFLAKQPELANRRVVLKLSSDQWTESEKLARLQHPYIVPIYSIQNRAGLTGICMPFFGETTLLDPLSRGSLPRGNPWDLRTAFRHTAVPPQMPGGGEATSIPPKSSGLEVAWIAAYGPRHGLSGHEVLCATLAKKLADALAHAHHRGIVHRDLKPANVLMTDDGDPMILDFNLSEDIVVGGRSTLMVGGTFPYMAPEHLEAILTGARVDERCDIYGLGVLLFEMLTGRQPFPVREGQFVDAVTHMIQDRRSALPLQDLKSMASPDMISIIKKCLAPRPQQRYSSAQHVSVDLQRHLAGYSLQYARNQSWKQRLTKWLSRNRHRATWTTFAVTLAVLASLFWATLQWQKLRGDKLAAQSQFQETLAGLNEVRELLASPTLADPVLRATLLHQGEQLGWKLLQRHQNIHESGGDNSLDSLLASEQRQQLQSGLGEIVYLIASNLPAEQDSAAGNMLRTYASAGLGVPTNLPKEQLLSHLRKRLIAEKREGELEGRLVAVDLLRSEKYLEAAEVLEPLTREYPESSLLWLLFGNTLAGQGNYSEAETAFTHSVARSPRSPLPYVYRGLCRMELQLHRSAEQDFSIALSLDANLPSVYVNRAIARSALNRDPEAIDDITQAIKLGRRDAQTYLLKSDIEMSLGLASEAEADLLQGLRETPTTPDGWLARAEHRLDRGEIQQALADYLEMARTHPQCLDAWQNLVNVWCEHFHDYAEALKAADKLVSIDPTRALSRAARSVVFAHLGKANEARAEAQAALAIDRDAATCYVAASTYAILSGTDIDSEDARQATQLLQESLAIDHSWRQVILKDPDWDKVRDKPEIQSLLQAVQTLEEGSFSPDQDEGESAAPVETTREVSTASPVAQWLSKDTFK